MRESALSSLKRQCQRKKNRFKNVAYNPRPVYDECEVITAEESWQPLDTVCHRRANEGGKGAVPCDIVGRDSFRFKFTPVAK
jgi:hypothetical protein